jgi:NAD(P)-dependent dehydrogenase (short-subunit alcohol dehydrogenase family)
LRRHGGSLPKVLALQLRSAMRQRSPRLRMSWGGTAIKSDVLETHARTSLFDRIGHEFGHLDILFANAGIAKFSPIEKTLEKDFDECLAHQRHCGLFREQA